MRISAGDLTQLVDEHELHLDAHYDPGLLRVALQVLTRVGVDWRSVMSIELRMNEFTLEEVEAVIVYDDGDIRTHRMVLSRGLLMAMRA